MKAADWALVAFLVGLGATCLLAAGGGWWLWTLRLGPAPGSFGPVGWILLLVGLCVLLAVLGIAWVRGRPEGQGRRCPGCNQALRGGWRYCPHCATPVEPR